MSEQNKALLRQSMEALNAHNVEAWGRLFSTDLVWHGGQGDIDLEAVKQNAAKLFAAFPDLYLALDDVVAEGNKVAARYTFKGTHRGEYQGIAPTGKQIAWRSTYFDRFAGGRCVEVWWVGGDDVTQLLK